MSLATALTFQSISARLRSHGQKITDSRRAVIAVLLRSRQPITAQALHGRLGKSADLASVYRSLHALVDVGVVQEEPLGTEQAYYLAEAPHHHISCRQCGKTSCLPCEHQFSIPAFKQVRHQLRMTGICQQCASS